MQNDCKNCIHLNVCAYVIPDIPTCDSFLSKDILDKIIATGNVNAISTEEMKALERHFNKRAEEETGKHTVFMTEEGYKEMND